MSQSSCNNTPTNLTPESLGTIQNSLLSHLAAANTPCQLSSFDAAVSDSASGFGGLVSNTLEGNINALKKTGCSDLAVVLGNYYNSVAQAKCVITNLGNTSTTTVSISEIISAKVGNNSSINFPPNCTINQSETFTINVYDNISSSVAQTLGTIAKQGLQNTLDQLQRNKSGYADTSSGSQQITSMQNILNSQDFQKSFTSNVSKAINSLKSSETFSLAGGDDVIINFPCGINQDIIGDVKIANIITAAYTGDFTSSLSAFLKASLKQKQETESSGVDALLKAMGGTSTIMLIIGAIVVLVLGVMLIKFMKSKNAAKIIDMASKKSELIAAFSF